MNTISIVRKTDKYKGEIIRWAFSYSGAKLLGIVDGATSIQGLLEKSKGLLDIYKPSNILMYVLIVTTILIYFLNWILKIIVKTQNPSLKMKELMKKYTAEEISELSEKTYSWGYNYCISYAQEPQGWSPKKFFIREYDDDRYDFDDDNMLPEYCQEKYEEFVKNSSRVKAIQEKSEERDRFAVWHMKLNTNKIDPKIDIKIKKTSWIQLQFNWEYFRLLGNDNEPIENKENIESIKKELKRAFEDQGVKFRLNSFCLHLIIATKKGVVLSRIGRGKENDYPLSWAATIGEQIEFVDFCSVKGNGKEYNKKFIECWVKRALKEELGIDSEEMFEKNSLSVLSLDMEADIYNIALTCVITLKDSFENFNLFVQGTMDKIENYELIEKNLDEIRDILLEYPNNRKEYHPSTYLRLLMYYRYKVGTDNMNKAFVKEYNKKYK